MLKIIAAAYADGWAYVEDGDNFWKEGLKIWVVKPPYDKEKFEEIEEPNLASALSNYGFIAQSLTFDNWELLIEFLKRRMVGEYQKSSTSIPSSEEIKKLAIYAPASIVKKWLNAIKKGELPDEGTVDLLERLTENPAVKADPDLQNQISALKNQRRI